MQRSFGCTDQMRQAIRLKNYIAHPRCASPESVPLYGWDPRFCSYVLFSLWGGQSQSGNSAVRKCYFPSGNLLATSCVPTGAGKFPSALHKAKISTLSLLLLGVECF
jgi:hypothetical protein